METVLSSDSGWRRASAPRHHKVLLMRNVDFALASLTVLGASGANAVGCQFDVSASLDGTTYSVLFQAPVPTATIGAPAHCELIDGGDGKVPIDPLPAGMIAFVHGVTGAASGTHVQVGGDARVRF
jgi:hypothetical protein